MVMQSLITTSTPPRPHSLTLLYPQPPQRAFSLTHDAPSPFIPSRHTFTRTPYPSTCTLPHSEFAEMPRNAPPDVPLYSHRLKHRHRHVLRELLWRWLLCGKF
ncbi:hypothetical protein E2C01_010014 [Portunus trituberculatus]|uniref:Uncharacterized protein n=1 Tax=Portunus trituberculatus TaxID=210409 RepID=A0A5B7D7I8_PORTR|nr:hypothetical protein [Portunus trituberculatus]